jgi:hypothetical protein
MAGNGSRAGSARGSGARAVSKISPSPMRLNAEEKAYARTMSDSKLRSDRARIDAFRAAGFDSSLDNMLAVRGRVLSKIRDPFTRAIRAGKEPGYGPEAGLKEMRRRMKRAAGKG